MYLQTAPEINTIYPYETNGCKISDYFYWGEQILRKSYTAREIIEETGELIEMGLLQKDLSVYEKYELSLPRALGLPVIEARREPPDYVPRLDEIGILRLDKPGFHHFVPGFHIPLLGRWGYSWDSLGVRPGREKYKITGIRIMRLDTSRLNFPLSALNPLN